jgi:PAS domain S-box-containing protein
MTDLIALGAARTLTRHGDDHRAGSRREFLRERGASLHRTFHAPECACGAQAATGRTVAASQVVELTNDAICICSVDGVIEYCNRAAERLYGWNADEAVGRVAHALFKTIFPVPLDQIEAQLLQTGHWEGELVRIARNGARVTVASRWALQHRSEHAPAQIVEVSHNMTDRRRLEAELAALEERVQRVEHTQAIGRVASGIAHDFNNILGVVLGYSELAQSKASEGRPVAWELDQLMQGAHRGKQLVSQILAFSRSAVCERVPVHVQSVAYETLMLLAASLPAGVRLQRELRAGDTAIAGDATQLHQVLMNLCTNAVQAMPQGGVLSVGLDRVAIAEARTSSHGMLRPGDHVRLQMSDTGTGIPQSLLSRIFDPFFTTKSAGKGTGLGLAIVHGIVTDWQGAIDVESREGAGTTFTVWLQACGEMAGPPVEDLPQLPQGHGESVMIVDDEPALVRIAEETLAQLGYDAAGFHSSAAALEALRAGPDRYDVVLADATMSGPTGTDLAHEIRKLSADVPIMLMSGHCETRMSTEARPAGIARVVCKPLLRRDLAEALSAVFTVWPDKTLAPDSSAMARIHDGA